MFKKLVLTAVAVALATTTVLAAPVAAKVATVEGETVTATLQADRPAWMKAGAAVRIKGLGAGKVTGVEGTTVTITTKKAGDAKVGQDLSIDKGGMTGC
jgi:ABC-type transporter Mla subunit MlaD